MIINKRLEPKLGVIVHLCSFIHHYKHAWKSFYVLKVASCVFQPKIILHWTAYQYYAEIIVSVKYYNHLLYVFLMSRGPDQTMKHGYWTFGQRLQLWVGNWTIYLLPINWDYTPSNCVWMRITKVPLNFAIKVWRGQ